MNKSDLKKIKYDELKNIAKDMDFKIPKTKDQLIDMMIECFTEYEKYKKQKIDKYEKIKQLGEKGKEGLTYLVKTEKGDEYAMKTFKKNKSSTKLREEARLQEMAYECGVSPKVIEIDTVSKYIVMDLLDKHLADVIQKQKGDMTKLQQKQIINIFKGLDKAKVFHADSNILNYMFKNKKLFIIDFGMSKEIDDKLIKKLGTNTPNIDLMNLGFILKLKELNCVESSYSHLLTYVSETEKVKFNL